MTDQESRGGIERDLHEILILVGCPTFSPVLIQDSYNRWPPNRLTIVQINNNNSKKTNKNTPVNRNSVIVFSFKKYFYLDKHQFLSEKAALYCFLI